RGLVELASIGAMALGLGVAAAVLLLDDGNGPAAAAPAQSAAEHGRVLFQAKGCVGCHTLAGVPGQMDVGPNLSGLAAVAVTRRPGVSAEAYVRESIREPAAFFVSGYEGGIRMPQLDVTDAELDDLIAFLLGPRALAPAEARRDRGAPAVAPEPLPAARLLDRSFAPSPPRAA
ncbi:MAG TPA: cytochrome c, partial [Chloroflexota bacterium]|nr:cytochrome c [Chloroflexota bacterium]